MQAILLMRGVLGGLRYLILPAVRQHVGVVEVETGSVEVEGLVGMIAARPTRGLLLLPLLCVLVLLLLTRAGGGVRLLGRVGVRGALVLLLLHLVEGQRRPGGVLGRGGLGLVVLGVGVGAGVVGARETGEVEGGVEVEVVVHGGSAAVAQHRIYLSLAAAGAVGEMEIGEGKRVQGGGAHYRAGSSPPAHGLGEDGAARSGGAWAKSGRGQESVKTHGE